VHLASRSGTARSCSAPSHRWRKGTLAASPRRQRPSRSAGTCLLLWPCTWTNNMHSTVRWWPTKADSWQSPTQLPGWLVAEAPALPWLPPASLAAADITSVRHTRHLISHVPSPQSCTVALRLPGPRPVTARPPPPAARLPKRSMRRTFMLPAPPAPEQHPAGSAQSGKARRRRRPKAICNQVPC
jgi:hypothetical protein